MSNYLSKQGPSEYDRVALTTKIIARMLAALVLASALCQYGCTSQTAIAIARVDDAASKDEAVATLDLPIEIPDAEADADLSPTANKDVPTDYVTADRAGPESGPEAGPEAGLESGPEAGPEAGPESGPEAGPEAAFDLRMGGVDSGATTLFFDNFSNGYLDKWKLSESSDGPITDTMDGTNKIATFDSSNADVSRLRCNLDGSYFTDADISASMKVRIDVAPTSTRVVRLDVRQAAASTNVFYAVGVTVNTDGAMTKVSVFKKVPDGTGNYTEVELAASPQFIPLVPMGNWRTIKLTISGTTSVKSAASFEGTPLASHTDDCTTTLTAMDGSKVPNGGCLGGQTGLGIQVEKGIVASVDDVLVTAP
jgi:hypothetical protein